LIDVKIFLRSPLNNRTKRFVLVVGLTMQLLIWFVNSNVQNAFSTGIIGLAYGPVFPASLTLANDILPPDIHMVSMAIMYVIYCSSYALLAKLNHQSK
jgi:fucose permease